jgi:hypothetical protein
MVPASDAGGNGTGSVMKNLHGVDIPSGGCLMPPSKMNIRDIAPFDYRFNGSIGGQMTDVGRNIGSW